MPYSVLFYLLLLDRIEQEGGRGNICFPVEEGSEASENRGFPRSEILALGFLQEFSRGRS